MKRHGRREINKLDGGKLKAKKRHKGVRMEAKALVKLTRADDVDLKLAPILPKSLKKSSNFVFYAHPYKGELRCEIILRVRAGTKISKANMETYAGLKPSDRHYKSVRGPTAVERLILEDSRGGFHIVPLLKKFFPHWKGL